MANSTFAVFIVMALTNCTSGKFQKGNYESETLKIEWVNKNIAMHISYFDSQDYGKVPCNGMVYFNDNQAVIFDTPTDDRASAELIKWIGKKNIKAVVVTHFHEDCLGGLQQFHSYGIQSHANVLTIALAKEGDKTLPQIGFENRLAIDVGNQSVVAEYFGQGHTHDNIVGYIESEQALFGGCLVKSLKAGKGNLADANVADWPKTIEKIQVAHPELQIVIPGHGKPGGPELLEYTIKLFTAH